MIKYFFLIILPILYLNLHGQRTAVTIIPLSGWDTYPVPHDSITIHRYAWDTVGWMLFFKNERIFALNIDHYGARDSIPADSLPLQLTDQIYAHDSVICRKKTKGILEVDDGYLVGINQGEWGGVIRWYSKDVSQTYKISDEQVYEFIEKGGHIYAIEGLHHTYTSKGNLIELIKVKGKWVSKVVLKLPFAPFGIAINAKNNFIIGTSNNLIEIQNNDSYKVLIERPIWNYYDDNFMYPKNLLIKGNIVYVGMTKGVLKYNLGTKRQTWLMPK